MLKRNLYLQLSILFLPAALFLSGCITVKNKVNRPILPSRLETVSQNQLKDEVNRLAQINSMRAKMDVVFEDNSYAEVGLAEKYRKADGEVVLQRPSNILLKIQAPIAVATVDIAQMTSDGMNFRIAILQDGGSGKNKKFILGTNNADYSKLQETGRTMEGTLTGEDKELLKKVNAFANIRPQHFTEAILMRAVGDQNAYVQSEFFQEEFDPTAKKGSPLYWKVGAYYFLDEFKKNADGGLSLARRFWFDRVGSIRLARQQIFDDKGGLDSDITYGAEASFTETSGYRMPLRIEVTRPKEKYKMSLTYQAPSSVSIGKTYNTDVFVLKNTWNLPEVDLDERLNGQQSAVTGAR